MISALLLILASGLQAKITGAIDQDLPPPERLLVDFLPSPAAGVGSASPLFSFSPVVPREERNVTVASLRVEVQDFHGMTLWDSGDVPQSPASPLGIRCGVELVAGAAFRWSASWRAADGRLSALSPPARFVTALRAEEDWRNAKWLGSGHAQFRASFDAGQEINAEVLFFLASPGGALLSVNGQSLEDADEVGVSGWFDWTKAIPSTTFDLTSLLQPGRNELLLTIGCGAWCPSAVPTMEHSGRIIHTAAGKLPLAKALLIVRAQGGQEEVALVTGDAAFSSRIGPITNSSSWLGSTIDWTLDAAVGWTQPARLVPNDTLSQDLPKVVAPLAQPPMRSFEQLPAESVVAVDLDGGSEQTAYVYKFATMVVGTATVSIGAWTGGGKLKLEFCEVLLSDAKCVRQSGYEKTGTVDTHIVDDRTADSLQGKLSWRGFQFVIVTAEGGTSFRGQIGDLTAQWAGVDLEASSHIIFEGGQPGSAEALTSLGDLAARSFRGNILSGLPTDCPTREKHGWLGDTLDIAVGAMYTFWAPTIFKSFVDQIIAAQATSSPADSHAGFVPVVVPCHQGVDAIQNDLSWTSGFVMTARWLALHYGDTSFVAERWAELRSWTDGQLSNATLLGRPGGLPDFSCYGDESASAREDDSHVAVGQQCAATTFIVALEAMADMAVLVGESEDAARWTTTLSLLRGSFDSQYWCPRSASFSVPNASATRQTVDAMAIAAGVGGSERRGQAGQTLLADITQRNFSLTVGSVGQKRLLTTLSAISDEGHDAALRVVLREEFPGWRYWLSLGATTCWESWTAMDEHGDDHFRGSRNHAWLCGGLTEWLYSALGGVAPSADGFAAVTVAPKISRTLGPSSVAVTLQTVRGVVSSNWTRFDAALVDGGDGLTTLSMQVSLPPGIAADVAIPLLTGRDLQQIYVVEGLEDDTQQVVWDGSLGVGQTSLVRGAEAVAFEAGAVGDMHRLRLRLSSGVYDFAVRSRADVVMF